MAKKSKVDPRATSEVDREIGARIRACRLAASMSQETLGERIGVTFQQIQKYEKGANRVSASKLLDVARVLELNPSILLPETQSSVSVSPVNNRETQSLMKVVERLNPEGRRVLASLARALVTDEKMRRH